jgi:hypothetical protein
MADTVLKVEGPIGSSGSTGSPLEFYTTEEATNEAETDLKPQNIPTQDDEDTLLAPIQGKKSFRWQGKVVGNYAVRQGFGETPKTALIRWLIEGESLVSSEQGNGYKVTDNVRDRVFEPSGSTPGVLIENLDGQVTEGMQSANNRQRYIDTEFNQRPNIQTDSLEISGSGLSFPLGDLSSRSYRRSIDLQVSEMIHNSDLPSTGLAQSGVNGELDLDGRVTRDDVGNLKSFAKQIVENLHGVEVTFRDSFTSREFSGAVTDSSATFEQGRPDIVNYRISLTVGRSPGTTQNSQ